MARTPRTGKKPSAGLSPEARNRILAAALEHPNFGVRRLARVLKGTGLEASESVVRGALKKEGLHTRELRLRLLEKRHLTEGLSLSEGQRQALEKFKPSRLEQAGTSALPGFTTEARAPMETVEPETPPAFPQKAPELALAEVSAPLTAGPAAKGPPPPRSVKRVEWRPAWEQWFFRSVNTALVCLAVYFAWAISSKFMNSERQGGENAVLIAAAPSTTQVDPSEARYKSPPLNDYHVVWERDLFGTSKASEVAARHESSAAEKIAVAEKNLGLRLIGTVVGGDPVLNYAVIDVSANREQGLFRERERVGRAVIRRILRNTVIIQTDTGQRRRLIVDDEPASSHKAPAAPLPNIYEAPASAPRPPEVQERALTINVPRQAVEPQADIRRLVEETPMSQDPDGLRLGPIARRNPLARIGLRTGDVVRALNGEEITGTGDAETIFQALDRGEDFTILVKRRGQLRRLNINIE